MNTQICSNCLHETTAYQHSDRGCGEAIMRSNELDNGINPGTDESKFSVCPDCNLIFLKEDNKTYCNLCFSERERS